MEFRAYPMPDHLPDYPSHWQIAQYFDDYVDHFDFRDTITFRTEIVKVQPLAEGGYDVTLRARDEHGEPTDPQVRRYGSVVVANGHHWDPRWPEPSFPGAETFSGVQMPVHHYKTPDVLAGKRVVVLGVPTDHLTDSPIARGPVRLQQLTMSALLRLARGRVTDYGLPEPDHAVLHAHPTVSDDLLTRLGHGDITVKPTINRFEDSKVFFEDGTAAEVDVVVYCTGYKVTFPFFDDQVVTAADNHVDLYRRVVDPEHPGLFFVGRVQPLGAVMPLAEAQAAWVADLVSGEGALPSYDEMRAQIREYDEQVRRRYVASKRHTIQVDFHTYLAEIQRERKASRARATGAPPPRSLGGRVAARLADRRG
jgi:hypothetical protein